MHELLSDRAGPAVPAGHRCVGLAGVAASAAIAHRDAAGPTVPVVDAAADLPATGAVASTEQCCPAADAGCDAAGVLPHGLPR
ncbi:hypothetical protein G6F68_020796 [Rhizopus microsporus]|nr:hypothetical protein G6F68_020796 [Rhizopus microsporus]